MKYVAILFSIYITLLALMPCQDKEDEVAFSFDTTISQTKTCGGHSQKEICPPFCTCNCCSTARYIASMPLTALFTKAVVVNYPAYPTPVVKQQILDIWQPPQIA
ncbi:hypothetical protein BDD43_3878 [Mucilaginibacter gracilis]|uniref:Uncharacterized protein n=1 Tax=Mucilaginibacter gracilis TaxID=423350 RepID=A0A495J5L3_9SPHI|nr:DUF6660 family protein [Mucilaginibacter gracilis]RKR83664.1 hypothetical protein BDD43_3878 [Mucilaginibacter gracilis]